MRDNYYEICLAHSRVRHIEFRPEVTVPKFSRKESPLIGQFIRICPWELEYFWPLAKNAKTGIVEIGRFLGGTTFMLAAANQNVPITSIDIEPKDDKNLLSILESESLGDNLQLIVGNSQFGKYEFVKPVDLLWIDGDHSYTGCLNDLNNWWDKVEVGGHILLHDCWGPVGPTRAVREFIKDKNVKCYLMPEDEGDFRLQRYGTMCHFQKLE
jgi:predicted O-methyltransferase YrrM